MVRNPQSTIRLRFARVAAVLACLCVIAVMPFPQLAGLSCSESSHAKIPLEDDGKCCEEQLLVVASPRHRICRPLCAAKRLHETGERNHEVDSASCVEQAIIGHRLANGLRAPQVL